jgi:hypothetical protein
MKNNKLIRHPSRSRSSWLVFCMTRTVHGSDLNKSLLYSQDTSKCDIMLYFCRYPQSHVDIYIWWLVPSMEQFMHRVRNNQYLPSYFLFLTVCMSTSTALYRIYWYLESIKETYLDLIHEQYESCKIPVMKICSINSTSCESLVHERYESWRSALWTVPVV